LWLLSLKISCPIGQDSLTLKEKTEMAKHLVTVYQSFKVTREVTFEVEADSLDEAIELVDTGEIDKPDFDDSAWKTDWNLQSETVEPKA
jgi:hypothetical protein